MLFQTPFPDRFVLIVPYRRRTIGPFPGQEDLILRAIDRISEIFGSVDKWVLGGGISVALHSGKFYRGHFDIDILVERSAFAAFVEQAKGNGYRAFREERRFSIPHVFSLRMIRELRSSHENPGTFVKLFSLGDGRADQNEFLFLLDLNILVKTDCEVMRADGKVRVPLSGFDTVPFTTPSGRAIRLAGLGYLREAKALRRRAIDRYDLGVIENLLSLKEKAAPLRPPS